MELGFLSEGDLIDGAALTAMPQGAAGPGGGVFSFLEHDSPVEDDKLDPFVVVKGIFECGPIDDAIRIEQGEVGEISGPQQAAIPETEFGRVQGSHLPHGVFKAKDAAFSNINAEHAREGAEVPGMRIAAAQRTVDCISGAVRSYRAPRLGQRQIHVGFGVMGIDGADRSVLFEQEVEQNLKRVRRGSPAGAFLAGRISDWTEPSTRF